MIHPKFLNQYIFYRFKNLQIKQMGKNPLKLDDDEMKILEKANIYLDLEKKAFDIIKDKLSEEKKNNLEKKILDFFNRYKKLKDDDLIRKQINTELQNFFNAIK